MLPVEPKTGIELIANAVGETVYVTVINHTNRPLLVGPKFFAVRVAERIHPFQPSAMKYEFPIRRLASEAGVSGYFQFRGLGPLEGATLIFQSPDAPPQKAQIKRRVLAAPVGRPTPSPRSDRR